MELSLPSLLMFLLILRSRLRYVYVMFTLRLRYDYVMFTFCLRYAFYKA